MSRALPTACRDEGDCRFFFPSKLGASDVILSFQLLATLGDSMMNWGNLCLQFIYDGIKVKIQGEPTLSRSRVSLNNLLRTLKREGQGILLELQTMGSATSTTTQTLSPSMMQLLFDYQDIFEIPAGLSPP